MNLMQHTYKFDISSCLKQLNRDYHRNYTMADLAEKVGVSRETMSRLTTDSKFSIIYTTAQEIFNFYPDMTEDGYFSFREVMMYMCDSDNFFIP